MDCIARLTSFYYLSYTGIRKIRILCTRHSLDGMNPSSSSSQPRPSTSRLPNNRTSAINDASLSSSSSSFSSLPRQSTSTPRPNAFLSLPTARDTRTSIESTLNPYSARTSTGRRRSGSIYNANDEDNDVYDETLPYVESLDGDGARETPNGVPAVEEELLNDARRFEDFETIDWIQDTLFERARRLRESRSSAARNAQRMREASYAASPFVLHIPPLPLPRWRWLERLRGVGSGSSRIGGAAGSGNGNGNGRGIMLDLTISRAQISVWLRTLLHATQSWLIVTLVGLGIGLNAALIDVVTSWLTDLKFGYCRVSWWLNSKFCCWEIDAASDFSSTISSSLESASNSNSSNGSGEGCADWQNWSDLFFGLGYFIYVGYACLFAFSAAYIVRSWAPYAAGSGISEIKCILAGFVMKGFLGAVTLGIKSLTLVSSPFLISAPSARVPVAVPVHCHLIGHTCGLWSYINSPRERVPPEADTLTDVQPTMVFVSMLL